MKSKLAICAAAIVLSACETNPIVAFDQAWNAEAKGEVLPISAQPIRIMVPKSKGVSQHHATLGTFVLVRDLGYTDMHWWTQPASVHRMLYEAQSSSRFQVHARYDNGAAGSGVRYGVDYAVKDSATSYTVTMTPVTEEVYQQGIWGKLPVPDFRIEDLYQRLANVDLVYTFEIDTPYNTESITANFLRSREVQHIGHSYRDPVTGKAISTAYALALGNTMTSFSLDVFPYRNGSKAVIHAIIPGMMTGPNEVDFRVLIRDIETRLTAITNG